MSRCKQTLVKYKKYSKKKLLIIVSMLMGHIRSASSLIYSGLPSHTNVTTIYRMITKGNPYDGKFHRL